MANSPDAGISARHNEHLRFVSRIYRMRMLGLGAGVLAIGGVLHQQGASTFEWCALFANGYVWPHAAYWLARRSRDPKRTEIRNLIVDSMNGGIWIAVMQFNLLPSALLVVMLSADKIGVGGWRLLARTATFQVSACLVAAALLGFSFRPQTTMSEILWCLPFMFVYPMALSTAAFALGRRVVRQNRLLDRLNRTDALTGLWNRTHWEEVALTELVRCTRTHRPAALLMLDIDHFKGINDRYGHPVGDEVLKRVGRILQTSVREIDTAARFGGDEFGAVLPEANLEQATEVAERIRLAVDTLRIDDVPDLRCSVSVGVAEAAPESMDSVDMAEWVRRADTAMYRGKQAGRNRIAREDVSV